MEPNIGISSQNRSGVVDILGKLLSDEYILYTKTRKYHWNVTGPQFNDLHKFFEAQFEELDEIIDDVAERIRELGVMTAATLAEFVKSGRIKEEQNANLDANTMLSNLLNDHEFVIRTLRIDLETCTDKYQDAGTTDYLTGLMEQHEKMAWMLRAFLEGKSL